MNFKHEAIKTISLLWLGTMLAAFLSFLAQALIARNLGSENFGIFVSSIGIINIVAPIAGFGVSSFWLKSFGEKGWGSIPYIKPSFILLIISTTTCFFLINIWAWYGPNDESSRTIISCLSMLIYVQVSLQLITSKYQLEERFFSVNLMQIVTPLLRVIFIGIILLSSIFGGLSISVESFAYSYLFIAIFLLLFSIHELSKMTKNQFLLKGYGEQKLSRNKITVLALAKESYVFGLAAIFYVIKDQSQVVIIRYILDPQLAGIYASAVLVINAICLLPGVIYNKFLMPKIHRWSNHDREKLVSVYHYGNKMMLALGLVIAICIIFLSDFIIKLLFGSSFSDAGIILMILSLVIPIRFLGTSIGSLLIVKDYLKTKLVIMGTVMVLNIAFNFWLVPIYGMLSVAYVTIVSDIVLVTWYYLTVKKYYLKKD